MRAGAAVAFSRLRHLRTAAKDCCAGRCGWIVKVVSAVTTWLISITPFTPGTTAGHYGRVLGYDNAHGIHHRHRTARVENVDFISFEDIESRFEREWSAIGGTQ